MQIVRCVSCDGFGWFEDDFSGEVEDCDWCVGVGYVYRDASGRDLRIKKSDYERTAAELERLEAERMRELGYSGRAKRPWRQAIRKDTPLGRDPPTPRTTSERPFPGARKSRCQVGRFSFLPCLFRLDRWRISFSSRAISTSRSSIRVSVRLLVSLSRCSNSAVCWGGKLR